MPDLQLETDYMTTKILIKSNDISGKRPNLSDLSYKELAINIADASLFIRNNNGIVDLTSWDNIKNKPETFTTGAHNHSISEILNLQNILSSKAPMSNPTFTGTVSGISKSMVGLGNVDNTSDMNKPISNATQTALNAKENTVITGTINQYYRGDKTWQTLDKNSVGLSDVDNTSDIDKPISNSVQLALDAKQNSGNYILDTDSRLTDARVPLYHDHSVLNTNTVIGRSAFINNTTGDSNSVVGCDALSNNTTGVNNIAIGKGSLYSSVSPSNNCAVGTYAQFSNVTGDSNCSLGSASLVSNTFGSNNTAVGSAALIYNTTGIRNTAIGTYSGSSLTTGSNNTIIGYGANTSSNFDNCIILGANAVASATGDFVLGSSGNPINTSSSVGSAGTAQALPSRPLGFLIVRLNGNLIKIPYYRV